MVPKQPLHFGPDPRAPCRLNYNLRKLSELPHHLLQSGRIGELKSNVSKLGIQIATRNNDFFLEIIILKYSESWPTVA